MLGWEIFILKNNQRRIGHKIQQGSLYRQSRKPAARNLEMWLGERYTVAEATWRLRGALR